MLKFEHLSLIADATEVRAKLERFEQDGREFRIADAVYFLMPGRTAWKLSVCETTEDQELVLEEVSSDIVPEPSHSVLSHAGPFSEVSQEHKLLTEDGSRDFEERLYLRNGQKELVITVGVVATVLFSIEINPR